jgi:hypothetical protein
VLLFFIFPFIPTAILAVGISEGMKGECVKKKTILGCDN